MTIERANSVESSAIRAVGYDSKNAVMYVAFVKEGAIWSYFDVPPTVYESICTTTSSVGRMFQTLLRGKYEDERQPEWLWAKLVESGVRRGNVDRGELLVARNEEWLKHLQSSDAAVSF